MYDILHGDCRLVLQELPDDSIDACVTDAPYGLSAPPDMAEVLRHWLNGDDGLVQCGPGFMAAKWDSFVPGPATWREVYRVLKPGGHLLCFAGTRTFDLMGISIRLAGFELRDSIDWVYLSGMPKSLDVSKAIDKAAGAERRVVGYDASRARPNRQYEAGAIGNVGGTGNVSDRTDNGATKTAPATEDAERWAGWGTALKPAHEPILVCRKPLREKTVEKNVRRFGTGGLNIDACRVATAPGDEVSQHGRSAESDAEQVAFSPFGAVEPGQTEGQKLGRWPPNVLLVHGPDCRRLGTKKSHATSIHGESTAIRRSGVHTDAGGYQAVGRSQPVRGYADADGTETVDSWDCMPGCPVAALDGQSGFLHGSGNKADTRQGKDKNYDATSFHMSYSGRATRDYQDGGGGASRMFPQFAPEDDPVLFRYCAKASRSEREAGLEERTRGEKNQLKCRTCGKWKASGSPCTCPDPDFEPIKANTTSRANNHPTVKPIKLMRWLCKLVTPPGGSVLDPFAGSGTTGCAAVLEGFEPILIEREAEYLPLIEQRLAYWAQE